ncbi:DNA primase DnaG [Halobellus sp. GM3]|uniref:DNA primase DnaG n=1 Tax=Halobellus sp. GM3 TaxID=3458410 RepID=UPI00403E3414
MDDTEKYLIHAAITADGIVERSDVVGAIFGQTEGLLGDDLDLRDLQQSSKVGRIDVEIDSQNGQSFGTVTIASSLDRVKTAILAASLETITRVGPCRATVEVTDIEDVREAKRREVVERAKELLSQSFDESVMSSTEILDEVKESVRVEDISEYEGLPAGPRVTDSDAVIVVEGRADVLTLLSYGVKNAIAVEGTNIPDAVADLTRDRTATAFFDGDRGGELVLRELAQVGEVDYVAFAPEGRSVEDLERHEVFAALRDKIPIESVSTEGVLHPSIVGDDAETDGERPDPRKGSPTTESAAQGSPTDGFDVETAIDRAPVSDVGIDTDHTVKYDPSDRSGESGESDGTTDPSAVDGDDEAAGPESADDGAGETEATDDASGTAADTEAEQAAETTDRTAETTDQTTGRRTADPAHASAASDSASGPDADHADASGDSAAAAEESEADGSRPRSLRDHVREVIDGDTGTVRFLDEELVAVADRPAEEAFEALVDADPAPYAVVVDDEFTQRLLDVAAQQGVDHAVATSTGEFVKKPVGVRLLTADQLANSIAS